MIVDNTLVLSDSQAITATAASTNQIDVGAAGSTYLGGTVGRDIGDSTIIPIVVEVTQAFNNLTSLQVSLETDDDVAFGSPVTVATGPAVPLASLVLGYKFDWPAEIPVGTRERYLRLKYTVVGTAPSTGKVFASVVAGRQSNPS